MSYLVGTTEVQTMQQAKNIDPAALESLVAQARAAALAAQQLQENKWRNPMAQLTIAPPATASQVDKLAGIRAAHPELSDVLDVVASMTSDYNAAGVINPDKALHLADVGKAAVMRISGRSLPAGISLVMPAAASVKGYTAAQVAQLPQKQLYQFGITDVELRQLFPELYMAIGYGKSAYGDVVAWGYQNPDMVARMVECLRITAMRAKGMDPSFDPSSVVYQGVTARPQTTLDQGGAKAGAAAVPGSDKTMAIGLGIGTVAVGATMLWLLMRTGRK